MDAKALHGLLLAIVGADPSELSKGFEKKEMIKIINAYDPTRPGSRTGSKECVLTELVAAIAGHDGFTREDPDLVKVAAAAIAQ